jgi:hypothetical protein
MAIIFQKSDNFSKLYENTLMTAMANPARVSHTKGCMLNNKFSQSLEKFTLENKKLSVKLSTEKACRANKSTCGIINQKGTRLES